MSKQTIAGYQLSPQQQRLWLLQPNQHPLYAQVTVNLDGEVEPVRLSECLRQVVAGHQMLRMAYVARPGALFPLMVPADRPVEPGFTDLTGLDAAAAQQALDQYQRAARSQPGGWETGSLVQAHLFRTGPRRYAFTLTIPSVAADSWSLQLLVAQLAARYGGNGPADAGEPLIEYAQFSEWQHSLLEAPDEEAVAFWKKVDLGRYRALSLPFGAAAPGVAGPGSRSRFTLEPELLDKLEALAGRLDCPLPEMLLACWGAWVHQHTGAPQLQIGQVVNDREIEELHGMVGAVSQVLPVQLQFDAGEPFSGWVKSVGRAVEAVREWQEYSFVRDQAEQNGQAPISVGFEYLAPAAAQRTGETAFVIAGCERGTEPFALKLSCLKHEGTLQLTVDLAPRAGAEDGARIIGHQLVALLTSVVQAPGQSPGDVPALSGLDRQLILEAFNAAPGPAPAGGPVIGSFEAQAARTPDRVAVVAGDTVLTYGQLNASANQFAHWLIGQYQAGPDTLTGLLMTASESFLIAVLGTMKAGAAYVPIDPDHPARRIETILGDTRCRVLITDATAPGAGSHPTTPVVRMDVVREQMQQYGSANPGRPVLPGSLAYVLYTSGSSGNPKGVMINHHSLGNLVEGLKQVQRLEPSCQYALSASITFDASLKQLFAPLTSGATVHLPGFGKDTGKLARYIAARGIDVVHATPSAWHALLDTWQADGTHPSLKVVSSGGEPLDAPLAAALVAGCGGARAFNTYGPTEICVNALCHEISGPVAGPPLIGKPLPNYRVLILDAGRNLVPVGMTGEICVGGAGLARGYLNNPELTADKFPELDALGGRVYATGDLGRWLPDGSVEFLGRNDDQLKIRGYRVETGEIEAHLRAYPGVRQAVVVPKDGALTAYFTARDGIGPDLLVAYLREVLPGYMVPGRVVQTDAMPLTAAGKIDKNHLLALGEAGPGERIAPRNALEAQLVDLWREILGDKPIGVNESFFEIGGHSLSAIRLLARLHKACHVKIELREIFANPTIEKLCVLLGQSATRVHTDIPPVPRQATYETSHAQQRLWLLDQFEPGTSKYNMPAAYLVEGEVDRPALEGAFADLVERHEVLRTNFEGWEGKPRQKIRENVSFRPAYVDLRGEASPEEKARTCARQEAAVPFDLGRDVLLRVKLLHLDAHKYVVLLTLHHIVADGWSMEILIRELLACYNNRRGAAAYAPQPLRVQYKDYAHWHNQLLAGKAAEASRDYWHGVFRQGIPYLQLPLDYARPADGQRRGESLKGALSPRTSRQLLTICQQREMGMFTLVLAALKVLFYRYTGNPDVVIGSPVSGRHHSDLENQVGLYLNTLLFKTCISPKATLPQVLDQVRDTVRAGLAHQEYPFDLLVAGTHD
ncbi:MAG: amino acid adenylation domain-containing protein, partial [Cytophagales bacterium]|nr:amino acid adenylation domain-containing protein [Cytophagales bacterium]